MPLALRLLTAVGRRVTAIWSDRCNVDVSPLVDAAVPNNQTAA